MNISGRQRWTLLFIGTVLIATSVIGLGYVYGKAVDSYCFSGYHGDPCPPSIFVQPVGCDESMASSICWTEADTMFGVVVSVIGVFGTVVVAIGIVLKEE